MTQYVCVRVPRMDDIDIGLFDYDRYNTLYFFTAGRYEYVNKGVDMYLDALGQLNQKLKEEKAKEEKGAAKEAKERCDKLDKVFPDTEDAKKEMKRLYLEALAADAESPKIAKEKYLANWHCLPWVLYTPSMLV